MNTNRLNNWLQLIGAAAVLAGLAMVAIELRQTADITHAELATGTGTHLIELQRQLVGSPFSETYARMLESPGELTTAEMVELNAFLGQVIGIFLRETSLKDRGIFEEDSRILKGMAPEFFSNAYAQSWWASHRDRFPPRVVELMDETMPDLEQSRNLEELEEIRSRL